MLPFFQIKFNGKKRHNEIALLRLRTVFGKLTFLIIDIHPQIVTNNEMPKRILWMTPFYIGALRKALTGDA